MSSQMFRYVTKSFMAYAGGRKLQNQLGLRVIALNTSCRTKQSHRLQYDITYRLKSWEMVLGMLLECKNYMYITFMSSQMFRYVMKSIMAYAGGRKS